MRVCTYATLWFESNFDALISEGDGTSGRQSRLAVYAQLRQVDGQIADRLYRVFEIKRHANEPTRFRQSIDLPLPKEAQLVELSAVDLVSGRETTLRLAK